MTHELIIVTYTNKDGQTRYGYYSTPLFQVNSAYGPAISCFKDEGMITAIEYYGPISHESDGNIYCDNFHTKEGAAVIAALPVIQPSLK